MLNPDDYMQCYVNGVKSGSSSKLTIKPAADFGGHTIYQLIGSYKSTYKWFNGKIDEVRIWNYALTDSEIMNEYNGAKCTGDSDYSYLNDQCNNGRCDASGCIKQAKTNGITCQQQLQGLEQRIISLCQDMKMQHILLIMEIPILLD